MSTKVVLKDVRISFCDTLFVPKEYEAGDGKFRHSSTFLVVPGSANDKAIQAAIKAEALAVWGKRAEVMLESMRGNSNKYCYTKGDLKADKYDGYEGMLVLASHRRAKDGAPGVFSQYPGPDGKAARLTEKDGKPYAGCYVNAVVEIYAQEGTNAGIRSGLVSVQFWRDGDAFSAGSVANPDDFETLAPSEGGFDDEEGGSLV